MMQVRKGHNEAYKLEETNSQGRISLNQSSRVVIAMSRVSVISTSHDEAFTSSLLPVFSIELSRFRTIRCIRVSIGGSRNIR